MASTGTKQDTKPQASSLRPITTSVENYSLSRVSEDAVFDVPSHGSGKHDLLKVATLLDQVIQLITM